MMTPLTEGLLAPMTALTEGLLAPMGALWFFKKKQKKSRTRLRLLTQPPKRWSFASLAPNLEDECRRMRTNDRYGRICQPWWVPPPLSKVVLGFLQLLQHVRW